MTPVIEALLIAFAAGTLASLVASSINRGIARVKRRRKLRKRRPDVNQTQAGVHLGVVLD